MDAITRDYIQDVIDLLKDKGRWTARSMARDAEGLACPDDDPAAVCWCLYGAIRKVQQNNFDKYDHQRRAVVERHIAKYSTIEGAMIGPATRIVDLNDLGGYEEVMKTLNLALIG